LCVEVSADRMNKLPALIALLWICLLFYVGIGLFMSGFLLVRVELGNRSSCADQLFAGGKSAAGTEEEPLGQSCWAARRFRRVAVVVIDALSYEFAKFDPENRSPRPYQNRLGVIHRLVSARPRNARLYPFRADAPTTTMQRVKGLTTGSLPTFIDISSNFASYAIQEDNLIQQWVQNGRKVVFMGDDTWDGLFPNQFSKSYFFPSFNVKDLHTVDNGVLRHLYPSVKDGNWDVLIAHFLGVDHCGHRYGPDQPAMADKLDQMNDMLGKVVNQLQNDTLLMVLGDHGMTDDGGHGGDSEKEVNAALFVYSALPLFREEADQAPESIPQIDLVPTLALLTGIPIPYSNIGKVIPDLFRWSNERDALSPDFTLVEALWINVKQVNRFLDSYSLAATDLPQDQLQRLKELFASAGSEYAALHARRSQPLPNLTRRLQKLVSDLQLYLKEARETCQASWARFQPLRMLIGILILAATCLLCYVVSETADRPGLYHGVSLSPIAWGAAVGLAFGTWQVVSGSGLEPWAAPCLAALASQLGFCVHLWRLRSQSSKPWAGFSVPLVILFLRCASVFSNSFVVAEGQAVLFLLKSLLVSTVAGLHWAGKLSAPNPVTHPNFGPETPKQSIWQAYKRESVHLLGFLAAFLVCVNFSVVFHGCREEQAACQPSPFLTPLSGLQDQQARNWNYALCLAPLAGLVLLPRLWLRHYGNLNNGGPAILFVRWGVPLAALLLSFYWAMNSAPESSYGKLLVLVRSAVVVFPHLMYGLVALGLLVAWWSPMTVFLKVTGRSAEDEEAELVTASRGTLGAEGNLLHVIPQIYRKMQRNLRNRLGAGEGAAGGEEEQRPVAAAYGLGSVYSAAVLIVVWLLALLLLLLHTERMSLSFLLLFLEAFAFLQLHAAFINLSAQDSGDFTVPWYAVTGWAFAATQFFYSTGHQPTFPTIQWNAAFVGFPEGHDNRIVVPAALLGMNTFASHIIFAEVVSSPLLMFWPLVCETQGLRKRRGGKDSWGGDEEQTMEMRLRESPQRFTAGLLQLGARYLFAHGVQLLASVCTAAILRRHLMVWKIFAPKFLFEAAGFVVTSVCSVLGIAFVMRVDVAVSRWFKQLILDQRH
uniref:GPI ethanolamine phosphate transferase 3, catalytic subunit n=1 Tax=Latimeria chalumnae TaxID=7897 RepID=H2ZWA7_LATCH